MHTFIQKVEYKLTVNYGLLKRPRILIINAFKMVIFQQIVLNVSHIKECVQYINIFYQLWNQTLN